MMKEENQERTWDGNMGIAEPVRTEGSKGHYLVNNIKGHFPKVVLPNMWILPFTLILLFCLNFHSTLDAERMGETVQ